MSKRAKKAPEQPATNVRSIIRMFARPVQVDEPPERFLEILGRIQVLREALEEVRGVVEQAAVEWIRSNGELHDGTKRYYIGTTKRTRCKDRGATLQAVMDAAGGDMELVVSTLASDAFKHGACRQILSDEAYSSLFTTSEVEKLEEGASKSEPKLQVFDSAFARKPAPKAG